MTADVLEDAHPAVLVAQQEQRQAEDIDGLGVTGVGHVLAEADTEPAVAEDLLAFRLESFVGGVEGVGQAIGAFDGLRHPLESSDIEMFHAAPSIPFQRPMLT